MLHFRGGEAAVGCQQVVCYLAVEIDKRIAVVRYRVVRALRLVSIDTVQPDPAAGILGADLQNQEAAIGMQDLALQLQRGGRLRFRQYPHRTPGVARLQDLAEAHGQVAGLGPADVGKNALAAEPRGLLGDARVKAHQCQVQRRPGWRRQGFQGDRPHRGRPGLQRPRRTRTASQQQEHAQRQARQQRQGVSVVHTLPRVRVCSQEKPWASGSMRR